MPLRRSPATLGLRRKAAIAGVAVIAVSAIAGFVERRGSRREAAISPAVSKLRLHVRRAPVPTAARSAPRAPTTSSSPPATRPAVTAAAVPPATVAGTTTIAPLRPVTVAVVARTVRTLAPPTTDGSCASAVAAVQWPAGWSVECVGARAGILGLTYPGHITRIYTRVGLDQSDYLGIALHEAGNAWDLARLDAATRATWCAARGCAAESFFAADTRGSDWVEAPAAEDWAESWRFCHGGGYARSYLGLAQPTPELCSLQLALVSGTG